MILWRERFKAGGAMALSEIAKGRGCKPSISAEKVKQIVEATVHGKPVGATHWSCRSMARAQGVGVATVHRIWDDHGLQPHRVGTLKLFWERKFVEKLTDVVGLYANPPDKAIVLCCDEEPQVPELDRTQPGLSIKQGRCWTMAHERKRHGSSALFAALDMLDGKVIGQCLARHRHQEFLKFLRQLDREMPKGLVLHLVVDNHASYEHETVKSSLAHRKSRFQLVCIPTSSAWLDMFERWFRDLTDKRIRLGALASVDGLIAAIEEYMTSSNADPHVFVWKASAESILENIEDC